jgi:Arc/MetJ-type ribon-helix-helix transcriptional regulator
MKTLEVRMPEDIYKQVKNLVKMKLFKDESEVVNLAVKKILAEQSREFLRDMVKNLGITEKEMLKTLQEVRE